MADEQNQETAVTTTKSSGIQLAAKGGLQLTGLNDMFRFAQYVSASGLAPKGMDKPEQVLIALEMGYEIGLPPMKAVQSISVINGRPSLWGDVAMGLVRASGLLDDYDQEEIGNKYADDYGWKVTSLRVGAKHPIVTTFTVADAKKAGLWGKTGPWSTNPDRMILYRARGFNLRDNFQDVLGGLITKEEAYDIPPRDVEYEVVDAKPASRTDALAQKLATPKPEVREPEPVQTVAEPEPEVTMEVKPASVPEANPEPTPEPKEEHKAPAEQKGFDHKRPGTQGYGTHGNVFLTGDECNVLMNQYGFENFDETLNAFSNKIHDERLEAKFQNHFETLKKTMAKHYSDAQKNDAQGKLL